jgi:hypothetical protein
VLHEADERFKALWVVGINYSAAAGFVAVGGVLRQAGDPVGVEVALVSTGRSRDAGDPVGVELALVSAVSFFFA